MPQPLQEPVRSVVEEFESGGYWSCRDLNTWLLVVVTLGFGITLGADVLYGVLVSEEFPVGLAIGGLAAAGCVIMLWASVPLAVTAGLVILLIALFVDAGAYSILLALLLSGLAALTTTKLFRRGTLAAMLAWAVAFSATLDDPAVGSLAFVGISVATLASYGMGSAFRHATDARVQAGRDLDVAQERHRAAKAAERRSIARDLHDIVAHDITIIAMQSRAAQMKDTDEAYREAVGVIGDSSRAALNDLRRMLSVLKDENIVDDSAGPLSSASELDVRVGAEAFAEELRSLGITVHQSIQGDVGSLSRSVSSALYRMLQECTTNVAKFGGEGAECWIEMEVDGGHVTMCVRNTVLTPERSGSGWGDSGAGLLGVRDRAEAFGGVTEAGYDDAGRWRVCVTGVKQS